MNTKTLLLILSLFGLNKANDYYSGFTQTLGVQAASADTCESDLREIVNSFEKDISEQYQDLPMLLSAVTNIVDDLRFELSPQCKSFKKEFKSFMDTYFGQSEILKKTATKNLDVYHTEILDAIQESRKATYVGNTEEAGKLQAGVLRLFLGIDRPVKMEHFKETESYEFFEAEDNNEEIKANFDIEQHQDQIDNVIIKSASNEPLTVNTDIDIRVGIPEDRSPSFTVEDVYEEEEEAQIVVNFKIEDMNEEAFDAFSHASPVVVLEGNTDTAHAEGTEGTESTEGNIEVTERTEAMEGTNQAHTEGTMTEGTEGTTEGAGRTEGIENNDEDEEDEEDDGFMNSDNDHYYHQNRAYQGIYGRVLQEKYQDL